MRRHIERLKRLIMPSVKLSKKNMPNHIIINPFHNKNPKTTEFVRVLKIIENIIRLMPKLSVPIITINLLSKDFLPQHIDVLVEYFYKMSKAQVIHKNGIKVSVLGKWYDLPGRVVTPIKEVIDETKEYDKFFLNFCINYNPHDEITDTTKIISRKIEAKKLTLDKIDETEFKDNVYSSYFLPADLIIEAGNNFSGTLLWDSVNAKIYLMHKKLFEKKDFLRAIRWWQKN